MSTPIVVCAEDELSPGERMLVTHDGREIGVFNFDGRLFATRNFCPHMAAPLCAGKVGGVIGSDGPHTFTYDGSTPIIACPWHHWEFRLENGTCLTDDRVRVRTYEVTVEDGNVTVHM